MSFSSGTAAPAPPSPNLLRQQLLDAHPSQPRLRLPDVGSLEEILQQLQDQLLDEPLLAVGHGVVGGSEGRELAERLILGR